MTRSRVLRALSRFDAATAADVSQALGLPGSSRTVWAHLQKLVADGLASRDGERGHVARYTISEDGRRAA